MRIVIDKALNHYMLYGSLILYGNIFLSLVLKKNKICNFFRYKHIVEIPTNKGANSYKLKILKKMGNWHLFIDCCWKGYTTPIFGTYIHLLWSGSSAVLRRPRPNWILSLVRGWNISLPTHRANTPSVSETNTIHYVAEEKRI